MSCHWMTKLLKQKVRNYEPHWIPKTDVVVGLFCLICGYSWAVALGHVNPFIPYASSLAMFPPEKYLFMATMMTYAVLNCLTHWLWSDMIADTIECKTKSLIPVWINRVLRCLLTYSNFCVIVLCILDMESYNPIHYAMTVCSFLCQNLSLPLSASLLYAYYKESMWYCFMRLVICLQLTVGSTLFAHFNFTGLAHIDQVDVYHLDYSRPYDRDFIYSAFGEWTIILGCGFYTITIGKELKRFHRLHIPSTYKETYEV